MAESTLTPQTAPRTIEGLKTQSPLKLRILMETMGGLKTPEEKMAFHNLKTADARADWMLKELLKWDTANGFVPGAPAAAVPAAAPAPAPIATQRQPVNHPTAPTVAAVDPAAMAAAAAATAEPAKRQPRTTSAKAAAEAPAGNADLGAEVMALLNQVLAASTQNSSALTIVTRTLDTAGKNSDARVTALEQTVVQLGERMKAMQQLQEWTLMALLTSLQETLGVGITDILGTAISDAEQLGALVDSATGKA